MKLRFDETYLKKILDWAVRLHTPKNMEEATMLADLRDYLMYACLDGLENRDVAIHLRRVFARLGVWLEERLKDMPIWKGERETLKWYSGFLFALE